ncbi:MAG: TolB family protein, partial [Myxococcales bacterium]
MRTRNLLIAAAVTLLAPLALFTVGCGDEPPAETPDAGQVRDAGAQPPDAGDGNNNGGSDAGTETDAGQTTDGGHVPLPGESRIWLRGDFATNDKVELGRYVLPNGPSEVVAGLGKVNAFDVSADGQWVAIATDKDKANRYDLYLMRGDGSELTKIVEMPADNRTIMEVRFSPDGQRLAFEGDFTTAGLRDVYVVPVALATATPVRVSPARPSGVQTPNSLQPDTFAWSRDSTHLAISGDFNTNRAFQLYAVDVTAATPAPVELTTVANAGAVATADVGVTNGMEWTAGKK